MWILVLITLLQGEPSVEKIGGFSTLAECFDNRENILVENKNWDGHFNNGIQAICIKYK